MVKKTQEEAEKNWTFIEPSRQGRLWAAAMDKRWLTEVVCLTQKLIWKYPSTWAEDHDELPKLRSAQIPEGLRALRRL